MGGFPCQAFSIAGLRQGFDDKKGRGNLFFELSRLIKQRMPRVVFLENVKNLATHNKGETFKTICKEIKEAGYHYTFKVLNAMQYGNLAQNRERIYIVAFKDKKDFDNFNWILPIPLTTTIKDIIDFDSKEDEKYYYTKGKYKSPVFEKMQEAMKEEDPQAPCVYQWRRHYVRKNKSGVIPTLTANQGEGGHNVCLINTKYGIRKMTPRECFLAQGFPLDFVLPDIADSKLYKQAGNSVCVPVVKRIAQNIIKAINI